MELVMLPMMGKRMADLIVESVIAVSVAIASVAVVAVPAVPAAPASVSALVSASLVPAPVAAH